MAKRKAKQENAIVAFLAELGDDPNPKTESQVKLPARKQDADASLAADAAAFLADFNEETGHGSQAYQESYTPLLALCVKRRPKKGEKPCTAIRDEFIQSGYFKPSDVERETKTRSFTRTVVDNGLRFLVRWELVEPITYKPTKLGRVVLGSGEIVTRDKGETGYYKEAYGRFCNKKLAKV